METIKELLTIRLGNCITVYTDQNNLTFENSTTEIVLRRRLMLEEYGPEIKYIKCPDNDTADALSRLPVINSDVTERDVTREQLAESYGVGQLDGNTFPLTYRKINKHQRKDKELVEKLKCANYHTKYFREGRNMFMLIYNNYKNFVPTILQKCVGGALCWNNTALRKNISNVLIMTQRTP